MLDIPSPSQTNTVNELSTLSGLKTCTSKTFWKEESFPFVI